LKWPLALVLGAGMWALSLPPYGLGILAVPALIPALYVLPDVPLRRVWLWGWLGGTLWETATLWWLAPTVVRFGGLPYFVALPLILLLCAVLGIYTAGYLATVRLLCDRRGEWGLAFAPMAWILWEWLRGWLFGGMPWWGPGYALSTYSSLLQNARWLGVLGLSLLASLPAAAMALWLRDRRGKPAVVLLPLSILLFAGAFLYGTFREQHPSRSERLFRVGYLQPEVSQSEKWDPAFADAIRKRLTTLSSAFKNYGLKLLVWPESCTPLEWDRDEGFRREVANLAATIEAPILVGSVLEEPDGRSYRNGAVLVLPDGSEGGRYAKTHLVPFGEYIPLRGLLGFARPLVEAVGEFTAGESLTPLRPPGARVGVTICFEGIFPRLVRRQVREGAEILINITNDAWYAGTPGPVQHYLLERVRAVELGRCLVRSANGGISGLVNPEGRLERTTEPGVPASFWGNARLFSEQTPYARVGDLWVALVALIVVSGLALPSRRPK